MFLTDESMDEFAQWQHDEAYASEPVSEIPTESDIENHEIQILNDCLNGQHTLRFEIISGRFTSTCEDGCR